MVVCVESGGGQAEWITWLESMLRNLARNIPKKTIVGVDFANVVETGDIIQRYFDSGHTKVVTGPACEILKRSLLY